MIPEKTECDKTIRRSLFCIFDGHGGDQCSIFLHAQFHKVLASNPKIGTDPKQALLECWDTVSFTAAATAAAAAAATSILPLLSPVLSPID
jgi:serine/threonine protein phosphatase PrpC